MPEMRFTEFPALSIDLRVGISRCPMTDYFSYLLLDKSKLLKEYLQLHGTMANYKHHSSFFIIEREKHFLNNLYHF